MLNLAIVKLVRRWIVKSWNNKFCSRLKISKVKRSEVRFVYPLCWNKLIRLGLNFRENFILLEFFEKNRKKIKDSRVEFYKCFYIMLWKNKMKNVCQIYSSIPTLKIHKENKTWIKRKINWTLTSNLFFPLKPIQEKEKERGRNGIVHKVTSILRSSYKRSWEKWLLYFARGGSIVGRCAMAKKKKGAWTEWQKAR